MAEKTGIKWTDSTFNIAWGCVKVSPACANCYAETWAKRTGFDVWGEKASRRVFGVGHWSEPLKWNAQAEKSGQRHRVFCSSMCDVFEDHPTIDIERTKLWPLIKRTPWLDWQLLTKRAERIASCLPDDWGSGYGNVWLGVTAENQHCANERIFELVKIPAVVRFVSAEPLLDAFDLRYAAERKPCGGQYEGKFSIDWLILGGESGSQSRITRPYAFQHLRWQARMLGVKLFFKQHGEYIAREQWLASGRGLDEVPAYAVKNAVAIGGDVAYKVGKEIAGDLLDGERIQEMPG